MQYAGTHKAMTAVALVSHTTPDHSPAQGSAPFQLPVKQVGSSASEALKASSASTVAQAPPVRVMYMHPRSCSRTDWLAVAHMNDHHRTMLDVARASWMRGDHPSCSPRRGLTFLLLRSARGLLHRYVQQ
jgi:hypothetical protein